MKTITKKSRTTTKAPKENRQLVVSRPVTGEDVTIFECDVSHPYYAAQLQSGDLRLFDPSKDDRGPEVTFVATWGNLVKTWFPRTQGVYVVQFKADTPKDVRAGWQLGFGDCTGPQYKRSQISKVYADLVSKHPDWTNWLEVLKVPAVFRKDADGSPGGSCVVIDPVSLPCPVKESELSRTFM